MANNLVGKLEAEFELKSDADEFFHSFGAKAHQLPDLANEKVNRIEVHEGDWKTEGSIKLWTYVIDGKVEVFKDRLKIDEENKTITSEAIDGDCMKHYKNYIITLQVISRGDSSFAKYTIDYEKLNENEPSPTNYLDWLLHMGKDVDASLIKA
ncbi:MLP-like protein 43 [Coffea arabica]|uniref:MLP-like protein 43 n=1 Tax=Coffea arabica TaxID=13443 RepID=A0A6P6V6B0_COFAR|nr:MLP-like protein 28 [Coffea arabica]